MRTCKGSYKRATLYMMLKLKLQKPNIRLGVILASFLGIVALWNLYLISSQSTGVHVRCDCGDEIATGERVGRYLDDLLAEVDPLTNRSVQERITDFHPSLAVDFLTQQEQRGHRCSVTPGLFSIRHRNAIWQEAEIGRQTFLVYGAYYDDRDKEEGPFVRVLVMVESTWPPTPTCHMWYKNEVVPTATKAVNVEYLHWQERLENEWLPYIVTCKVRSHRKDIPQVVSLVNHACGTSTNALKIHQEYSEPKKSLAVCHKFVYNPARDFSIRLVEWIEALRAWGVDHLTIYEAASHPNVKKVLTYYQTLGFLSLLPWTSPGSEPQSPYLYRILYDTQRYVLFTDENVPYTDCLLRHIGTHQYIGVWDVDEFILPSTEASLPKMMKKVRAKASEQGLTPTSYLARCTYYFDDLQEEPDGKLPEYFHMLRHIKRTVKFTPPRVFTKAIHDTSYALGLHAHFALLNLKGEVSRDHELYHMYPASEAQLAHYRHQCQGEDQTECKTLFRPHVVRDTTMWKYKHQIVQNTTKVLVTLKLTTP
ncbi:hypothetical protein SK128_023624 [Halocaridina rubra]|uniref:Glycosyltransferase family 92 protein n=1 Tax=Halocaridina rubra TaxID=373956 RepID=A0AAN8XS58_HALRR